MRRHDALLDRREQRRKRLGSRDAAARGIGLDERQERLAQPRRRLQLLDAVGGAEIARRAEDEHSLRPGDVRLEIANLDQIVDIEEDLIRMRARGGLRKGAESEVLNGARHASVSIGKKFGLRLGVRLQSRAQAAR